MRSFTLYMLLSLGFISGPALFFPQFIDHNRYVGAINIFHIFFGPYQLSSLSKNFWEIVKSTISGHPGKNIGSV